MAVCLPNLLSPTMPGWPGMYTAMRAAIAAGMSAYRVAQLTGMTQRAVHRIRDREIGAAATRE